MVILVLVQVLPVEDGSKIIVLHRPKRKMKQNAVMICIFYNYVSSKTIFNR
jgi:hypothetical protein